ncbi:hypothetical protein BO70DRAFT_427058 [Aspergillus heteromorphus CBS 117.55]|uniref:SigF-like NTF2-like domain-containing protein n=1 Tax=Aspergillus heteromorphus CBS 117.55 TaxID=1448321 RepID=A0A317WP26_9EURO|nr:uncharacterized protein BO70DRAFT_427058 [Aspergillus heteromorphus CBS 117.55]PWY88244.1 hypothetical protein BO70DRAFT_427058 [Aspergillus heteromorphus CBS 117.55]
MEDPVREIPTVIQHLVSSRPQDQHRTIQKYFTPSAAFIHPFCRVPSYDGSRWAVEKIYQWYKIMSPTIALGVESVAYDKPNQKLYVTMHQTFSIWLIPFHSSPVHLTTVLSLTTDPGDGRTPTSGPAKRYYIAAQEDCYQPSEFVKFVLPWGGMWVVLGWQVLATVFCFAICKT